jgi:hypothetical protein
MFKTLQILRLVGHGALNYNTKICVDFVLLDTKKPMMLYHTLAYYAKFQIQFSSNVISSLAKA